ncbi:hypothetical protein CFOL_v3_10276 [Cephalotus follicularis]|uniref:Uncharacterized protein n=1 Tax=Cephalotus follicularis TaxID=3775 RepID=A0A1Q3BFG1_CEPFO|nr:hypothetical protein CFOL_v3_10276 [Cephalotus follicularis]
MGSHKNRCTSIILPMVTIVLCFQQILAMRPLEGEQWLEKRIVVQSLQRGPVTPSGPNPCTYIPGRGTGRCTFEMDAATHDTHDHESPAFPHPFVKFAAASSVANETQKPDNSSS